MYCQALSGNEYNTAGDTGSGGGGFRTDGSFCLHVQSASFFSYFHRKTKQKQQKKVAGSSGRIFFKSFNWKKKHKGFFAYFQSRKGNMWALRNGYFFLKLPVLIFFIENIRNLIKKKRYPGVDIKLYIAALHIKKKRDLERCTQLI